MKGKLKFLSAVLLAVTVGIGFIPLIRIGIVRLSAMDVMKTGLGFYSGTGKTELIFGAVQAYMEPYAWCIAAIAAAVLAEAFLTAVLSGRKAYVISLISVVLDNLAAAGLALAIWMKLEEVKKAVIFLDLEDSIRINFLPVILWGVIYLLILTLSIIGICLYTQRKSGKSEDAYLEQIRMLEQRKKGKEETAVDYSGIIEEKQERVIPKKYPERTEKTGRSERTETEVFTGAIVGEEGRYAGKVYPLENLTEIYFCDMPGGLAISQYQSAENLAGVYYIQEYGEYCVEPLERRCIYLTSGQPLGKGRKYYLPRGTGIFVRDKKEQFILA